MLSDSPSNYMKEQECTDFIVNIPVVWDDLKVLDGKVGDYLLLARKSGNDWFVGALTDWTRREMDLNLSFLPAGELCYGNIPGRNKCRQACTGLQASQDRM